MATTVPALRGVFGSTEYWLTTMSIGELITKVRLPNELEGWDTLDWEERYQRDINLARVRKTIAPYFATDSNRFSGSLILAVMHSEDMLFEPLSQIGGGGRAGLPQLYQSASREMGFLTFQGPEILVPLDGQHRVKAFKFAIDGSDDNNRPIPDMRANQEIARDQVTVILIRWDPQKARYIFNKINQYAKPTTTADNVITDDDDAIKVISRRLSGRDGVIPNQLVRHPGNALNATAREFTTLVTFNECNDAIIKGLGFTGHGPARRMDKEQQMAVTPQVRAFWVRLLNGIDLWAKALEDPTEGGDQTRREIREQTLLGKPIGQLALIIGYLLMRERCVGTSEDELCDRLNRIDWSVGNPMWHGVLMNPNGRVMWGKGAGVRASEFIAHLGGAKLTADEEARLLEHIHGPQWREQGESLPDPVA